MVDNLARKQDIPVVETQIKDDPVKWCAVSLSEVVERGNRLEASVFDVEAKQAWELIMSNPNSVCSLGGENGLTTSYTCGRFKRIWVKDSKFPIYQPSSIVDIKPTPDGYLSHNTHVDIDSLRVYKGQILLTCSGTIGKITIVSDTLNNAIFSHDLLRINCKNEIDIAYIYTYLKSKVGNKILVTNKYGAVITHIESEHLNDIPIPNATLSIKQKIHNLIMRSYELRDESNELIDKAQALLVKELKLPPIQNIKDDRFDNKANVETFNVKLSEMQGRADASYHVPIVDAILKILRENAEEVTVIGDKRVSSDIILPGRFKRVYVDKGYGTVLIGGKQIYELDPTNKKYLSNSKHDKRIIEELELQENMILITRSGTIGKVCFVPKHWENWVASEHIIRVVPADRNIAGYISIFLSSDYGYELIKRFTYGSVVDEIDDNHVSTIEFPLLKNHEVQTQINSLALEANEKRYEAYKLEQQALQIMDNEVIYAK